MDFSDIALIKAVVQAGSLSEASAALGRSQPTLSRKLSRLEDQLKTQLFYRSPRGLEPTEIARTILAQAEPLTDQLKTIDRHVELYTQLQTGRIRLGVGPIIEQVLMPSVLQKLIAATGEVEITVSVDDDTALREMLLGAELDVIIGPFPPESVDVRQLLALPMLTDDLVAVARPRHPIFAAPSVTINALRRFDWAAPKTPPDAASAARVSAFIRRKLMTDNYDLLRKLTLATDLICVGPRMIFRDDVAEGALRLIDFDLRLRWRSALVTRRADAELPLIRRFADLCAAEASALQRRSAMSDA
ncbi:MAG: LysR family transcriptional regulator [Pseudomonadota bacterium]